MKTKGIEIFAPDKDANIEDILNNLALDEPITDYNDKGCALGYASFAIDTIILYYLYIKLKRYYTTLHL